MDQEAYFVNPSAEHSLDDDYMPLAEKYDAGIATDSEIEEMQRNFVTKTVLDLMLF